MIEFITSILKSDSVVLGQAIIGTIATVILIYLFFNKNSRDERGRAIIGKASIISILFFLVLTTVLCQTLLGRFIPISDIDAFVLANTIQFLFNSLIIVEIAAILILRKLQ